MIGRPYSTVAAGARSRRPLLGRSEDEGGAALAAGRRPGVVSQWREQFLAGGQANLKAQESAPEVEENRRLQAKVGELVMENELLYVRGAPWRRAAL